MLKLTETLTQTDFTYCVKVYSDRTDKKNGKGFHIPNSPLFLSVVVEDLLNNEQKEIGSAHTYDGAMAMAHAAMDTIAFVSTG